MSSQHGRSTARPKTRPTVQIGRHLEKHLLAYAAAASAGLLSTLPAEAQIVYTPSNTPMAIAHQNQGPALTQLDLNNDGIPDFTFRMLSARQFSTSGTTIAFKFYLQVAPGQAGNQAVSGQQPSTASAVPAGVAIGPQEKFAPGGLYLAINSFGRLGSRSSGTWRSVEFAYVGLKFLINGQVHYGWARVKFPYPGATGYPSIYGYAYESTPNQPIVTGQTSGTARENASANVPASLGLLAAGAPAVNLWRRPISAAGLP
jgi:hypothetical protein